MKTKLLAGMVGLVVLSGCNLGRGARAYMQSTADFTACTSDPRIFCEPGSEALARRLAPMMPAALAAVEQAHYGRFTMPVRVQTYASRESFARYSAVGPDALGATTLGVVHLSPLLADTPDSQPKILAHELSHLHLFQQAGTLATMRLPNWFMEGWPTVVSHGGGAGPVTREQAIFALLHGVHFEPDAEGSLFFPKRARAYRLSGPMYYRQASMMVDYMQRRDRRAFERMVRDIVAGKAFAVTVQTAYGQPLAVLWRDFLNELRTDPAAAWPYG